MRFAKVSEHEHFSPEKLKKTNLFESPQMFCDTYCLEPGQSQKVHAHAGATKFYYVLAGRPTVTIGDESRVLEAGEIAWSFAGEAHGVTNGSDERVVLLVAMAPHPDH